MSRLNSAAATAAAIVAISCALAGRAEAEILVRVEKATQRMAVIVDGEHRYDWPVSTGVGGTPSGKFKPQSLSRYHRSSKYGGSPMPYAVFYDGNYAIHATPYVTQLGGAASRGCIRLHPSNAATLFALVQKQGFANTRIVVE